MACDMAITLESRFDLRGETFDLSDKIVNVVRSA